VRLEGIRARAARRLPGITTGRRPGLPHRPPGTGQPSHPVAERQRHHGIPPVLPPRRPGLHPGWRARGDRRVPHPADRDPGTAPRRRPGPGPHAQAHRDKRSQESRIRRIAEFLHAGSTWRKDLLDHRPARKVRTYPYTATTH
jgi:hypothetical protein